MKLSREQARDLRTGRAWAMRVTAHPASPGPLPATTYAALTAGLAALRTIVAADRPNGRPLAATRRSHQDLDRVLADAIAYAFSADARGTPTPAGIASWAAEGLARSYERELAMFAAMDVCGLALREVSPNRRWGDSSTPL